MDPTQSTDRAVLFTGLVRNEPLFLAFLAAFEALPAAQQVPLYFSTWRSELDRYPEVQAALSRINAVVIEQKEPDLVLPGHTLHQMATLDMGLSVIGPGVFVFKSRPDFAHLESYLAFLDLSPLPVAPGRAVYPGQRCRFHVLSCFPSQPLYINDITFAGCSDDLRLLADCPLMLLLRHRRVAPEQMIWGGAVLHRDGVLDAYFRANVGLIFDNEALFDANRRILLDAELYPRALAAYFDLLDTSFADLNRGQPRFSDLAGTVTLEDSLWRPMDLPGLSFHPSARINTLHSLDFASAVRQRLFRPSPLLDAVCAAWEARPRSLQGRREGDRSALAQAASLGEATRAIGFPGHKVPVGNGRWWGVDAAPPDWRQVGARTPQVAELEAQVNQMRRTIDTLASQLPGRGA